MNKNFLEKVATWTETDLATLPKDENDFFEYKCGRVPDDALKNKISIAASAFWNSGGGIFVAGVDEKTADIDGGILNSVGRQSRRDWVDQALSNTEPSGVYQVNVISGQGAVSKIKPDHCVLVIAFTESQSLPHMAYDKKYYVRAGAHSVSAGHFLVEALRMKRRQLIPFLHTTWKKSAETMHTLEIHIRSLNDAPALKVELRGLELKNAPIYNHR